MSMLSLKELSAKVRNLFSIAVFRKRYDDGKLQVQTLSGRVLEGREAFPYGFKAKAKTGKCFALCQGGNFDGFEILPLVEYDGGPKLEEGDAALYTAENGNIKIAAGGKGKIFLGNNLQNMCGLIIGLIDEIEGIITFGSPASQTISPATKAKLELYKAQVKELYLEAV